MADGTCDTLEPIIRRPHLKSYTLTPEERRYYDDLIAALVHARKTRGVSQAALDEIIGVSEGLTAKWESRARFPGAFYLMCWCKALGVTLCLSKEN